MTALPVFSAAPLPKRQADRTLLETIFSYLRWGYGSLIVSCLAYGFYLVFHSTLSLSKGWSAALATCAVLSSATIASYVFATLRKSKSHSGSTQSPDLTKPHAATRVH